MSLRINNNVDSMIAYRHLESNNTKLSKSLEKLASGQRINSAADGPAALVVSEKLRAQLGGLEQAIRNNESGVSMVQTAEGSLGEVARLLIDVRQRAVAAANEGANDEAMVEASQAEIENALAAIDRVASNTQFGRRKLLDGSGSVSGTVTGAGLEFVKGSGDVVASDKEGYDVSIKQAAAQATLSGGKAINESMLNSGEELTIMENGRTAFLKLNENMTVEGAVGQLAAIAEKNGLDVTVSGSGGLITVTHNKYGEDHKFTVMSTTAGVLSEKSGAPKSFVGSDVKGTINGEGIYGNGQLLIGLSENSTTAGLALRYAPKTGMSYDAKNGTTVGAVNVEGGLRFQIGSDPNQSVGISISDTHTSRLGRGIDNDSKFLSLADIDVRDVQGAQDAMNVVDQAIEEISSTRGELGAFQRHTFGSAITTLRVVRENLTAAESVIRDTDMAEELARFTRNQIMVQSSTAQLAQANAVPQNVVRLLANQ